VHNYLKYLATGTRALDDILDSSFSDRSPLRCVVFASPETSPSKILILGKSFGADPTSSDGPSTRRTKRQVDFLPARGECKDDATQVEGQGAHIEFYSSGVTRGVLANWNRRAELNKHYRQPASVWRRYRCSRNMEFLPSRECDPTAPFKAAALNQNLH